MLSVTKRRAPSDSGATEPVPMIHSLSIKNFRCFEDVQLADLGLINVIVGEPGAGKTAILESIFLGSSGNTDIPSRLRGYRGLGSNIITGNTREGYESHWKDLFFALDDSRVIDIKLDGDPQNSRELKVWYDNTAQPTTSATNGQVQPATSDPSIIRPITLQLKDGDSVQTLNPAMRNPLSLPAMTRSAKVSFFFSAFFAMVSHKEPAKRFSDLSKQNKDGAVRRAIKSIYPDLGDLSVETIHDDEPALYCKPPGSNGEYKLPVALVSSGMNKVLSILLGIANNADHVVLIDELENGLYFKTFPKVWEALYRFAHQHKTQFFITTHSMECLKAALPTLEEHLSAFRLIRVERKKGVRKVLMFSGERFEAAIESDYEVR